MTGELEHGGNVYEAIRRNGGVLADYLDFSANINPLGLSPGVRAALSETMDAVACYPDPDATALKQSIAKCYQADSSNIETGNGAVELIYFLCRALAPDRILIPAPTFGEYAAGARAAGVRVETLPLHQENGFRPDPAEMARKLRKNDLLFFCNPNNPTGVVLNRRELEPLIQAAGSTGAHIVVDESFIDFRPSLAQESCRSLAGKQEGLVVLQSLTKFLAIPGLRLGFLLAPAKLVQEIKNLRDPWNVNVMAQAAGAAGLDDRDYRHQTVAMVQAEKEYLFREFQKLPGFSPLPPSVNFMLADIGGSGWDALRLQEALWPHRILIRNCGSFPGLSRSHIRVAIKSPPENRSFVDKLKTMFCGEDAE